MLSKLTTILNSWSTIGTTTIVFLVYSYYNTLLSVTVYTHLIQTQRVRLLTCSETVTELVGTATGYK
jgi:hypothetical protein